MKRLLSVAWTWLRAVSGDSAYDTYLRRAHATGTQPVPREDFYLEGLRKRYSTVSRCC